MELFYYFVKGTLPHPVLKGLLLNSHLELAKLFHPLIFINTYFLSKEMEDALGGN